MYHIAIIAKLTLCYFMISHITLFSIIMHLCYIEELCNIIMCM